MWQTCDTLENLAKYKNILLDHLSFDSDQYYQEINDIFDGRHSFSDGRDDSGIGYLIACLEVNSPSWNLRKISSLKQPKEEFICKRYD